MVSPASASEEPAPVHGGFWIADLRFVNAAVRGLMHYENVMLYLEVAQREEAVREGNVG
jgi:hypothetical protein